MKNVLLAILFSFILVLVYTFIVLVIVPSAMGLTLLEPPYAPQLPLILPSIVFDQIVPDSIQYPFYSTPGGTVLLRIIFFFFNVLIYSIPLYLLIKVFSYLKNSNQEH